MRGWMIMRSNGNILQYGKESKYIQSGMPKIYHRKRDCEKDCDETEKPAKVVIMFDVGESK